MSYRARKKDRDLQTPYGESLLCNQALLASPFWGSSKILGEAGKQEI